ncbi:MAG: hypothetical protein QNJ42_09595 [Crocosphaera sp.]|nr:hypothetical protein [Crocosphaera sp.]
MEKDYLEIVVNITIVITAIFAAIKFQLYEVLIPRYNTEMKVEQKYTKNGKLFIICTYVIENTGQIPINLSEVSLQFYDGEEYYEQDKNTGQIQCPEKENHLPKRKFSASNSRHQNLMRLSAGEKSEFPIRGIFNDNKREFIFIYGNFKWKHNKKTFPYHHIVLISRREN